MATDTTTQIIQESPDIEAYKKGLLAAAKGQVDAANANALKGQYLNPDYQVAGMTGAQTSAINMGKQGIGAYQPYLSAGQQNLGAGTATMGEAADVLRGADTRGQFAAAQQAYNQAAVPASQLGQLANVAGVGLGYLNQGAQGLNLAQQMAMGASQADLQPSQNMMMNAAQQAQQAAYQPGFGQATGALNAAQNQAMAAGPSNFAQSNALLGQGLNASNLAAQQAAQAAQQPGFQQGVNTAMTAAQQAQLAAAQPGFNQAQQTGMQAANAAMAAANQPGFGQAQGALQSGIGALQGAAQAYNPSSVQGFMNPYQQQVIDESIKQINRQGAQANEAMRTQAIRAGAFGGGRNAVMQAEMQRNLADAKNAAITNTLSQGYGTAQQQAMQAFQQQQANQLAQGQGLSQAAGQAGSLASQQAGLQQQGAQALAGQAGLQASIAAQQAGLGQNAAQQLAQAGQLQTNVAGQQGQLGLQAAQQQFQAAGYDANTAMQMAQLQQTQQQQGLAQSQALQGIGSLYGQQAAQQAGLQQAGAQYAGNVGQNIGAQQLQQAGLGQSAAGLYGQISGQQAGLAGQQAGIAGQQANILGQQSQLQQQLGQGIGNLAGQQFGIGSQMAQGLGSLGAQLGNMGVQQAALGQTAQQLGQGDVNFLYNLGSQEQRQNQAVADAQRASTLQKTMQPYQQMAFLSDIYKGAPSSQMAMTTQSQAAPSPFQQIAGLGTGIIGTAAAANKSGLF